VVETTGESNFLDQPRRVAAAVLVSLVLAAYSSVLYDDHWQSADQSKTYFTTLDRQLADREDEAGRGDREQRAQRGRR
jgi:hypothetical protein